MEDNKLTLNQNLCGIRIFLNIFNLYLEEVEDINSLIKFKIFNKKNDEVGLVSFRDELVNINCLTMLGNLSATCKFGKFSGFKDIECGGLHGQWSHDIKFKVKGMQNFNGDMQIDVFADTSFDNNVRVHCKLNYLDKTGNKVDLKVMSDGYFFKYNAIRDNFKEVLAMDPINGFDSYMCHIVVDGMLDEKIGCYPYEFVRNVWHVGTREKEYLRTKSYTIKDSNVIDDNYQLHKRVGENNNGEALIQRGNLIHDIDKTFSEKIIELINVFKVDDLSFLENLITISFDKFNDEIKKAWFGVDVDRIEYYNGADNLIDAYFNSEDNKKEIINDVYRKILKK